jgi:hypothetical protein
MKKPDTRKKRKLLMNPVSPNQKSGEPFVLTPEQLAFYRENEYLILPGVVPEDLLNGMQAAIERWVDQQISDWIKEGKLQRDYAEQPFKTRLMHAWQAAGRPQYNPNPTQEIVGPELFAALNFPVFIDVCKAIFESNNITANGVFHCRPDLPDQDFTDTPWHQDAQCCRSLAGTKFVIMWIPLMDVDEHNGCLQAAAGRQHKGNVYRIYNHPVGHYISMRPDDVENLVDFHTLRMKRGDLLLFNELLPHRALPNHSDTIRWSVDLRYHESSNASVFAANRAFVCAHEDPDKLELSYDEWVEKMFQPAEPPPAD